MPATATGRRVPRRLAQAGVVLAVAGGMTAFSVMHKDVTLDVDGEIRSASVYGRTVAQVLAYQDVPVAADDLVEPGLDSAVRNGSTIVVRTARTVSVEIDGRRETLSTTARTVGELLTALGPRAEAAITSASRSQVLGRGRVRVSTLKTVRIAVDGAVVPITTAEATVLGVLSGAGIVLGETDTTSVPLGAAAVDGMVVVVNRAATSAATVTEALAFETKEIQDPSLPKGHRKVEVKGRVGEAVSSYAVETLGGVEVTRTLVTRTVRREPVNEVIRIGTMTVPDTPPVSPGSARAIGKAMAAERGWGDDEFACLDRLYERESHWNVYAENKRSGAYGIPQAMPGSKMASAGADWRTNPTTQIRWGLGYIAGRYGTPCGAWAHSQARGWY